MADRGQEVAAAWPPRALLILTAPRAGRREVERALLPPRTRSATPIFLLRLHRLQRPSSAPAIAAERAPPPSSFLASPPLSD